MPISQKAPNKRIELLGDLFAADAVKLLLSTLIIVSLLPFAWVQRVSLLFFAAFAIELTGRGILLHHQWVASRQTGPATDPRRALGRPGRTELLLLLIDLVATLSFLPLDPLVDVRLLRLIRLSRMLLLLSYWSPIGREIWLILSKRERRYQLFFVASIVVMLTFTSALLLFYLGIETIDFNEDGSKTNESFWTMVWWSFRQLQDPGNLLKSPTATLAFVLSLLLTLSGIFVIAFLIGIGASVVGELVQVGRERRLGLRDHSLICNLGRHSRGLVIELVNYYEKSGRAPRLATLGQAASRYDYMYTDAIRAIRYRSGSPSSKHDLLRVDADRARRVILLADGEDNLADSEVISQMLSVREVNPSCPIYAELNRVDNVAAARVAGGNNTVPILAHHLISLLLADIISFPGVEQVYGQLLSSEGNEIYTCIFGSGALSDVPPPKHRPLPFSQLLEHAYRRHGVLLLGYLAAEGDRQRPVLNPGPHDAPAVSGYIGLAPGFDRLLRCVRDISQLAPTPDSALPRRQPLPQLALRPVQAPLESILICGYHDGLAELCRQLAIFAPGVALHVMVPKDQHADRLRDVLRHGIDNSTYRDEKTHSRKLRSAALVGEEVADGTIRLRDGDTNRRTVGPADQEIGHASTVRVFAGDWTEGDDLLRKREGFDIADVQTIVLTYTLDDADPDARTALTLLKLHHLTSAAPDRLHPRLRVVSELRSSEKAGLLQTRFAAASAPDPVIIPTEQLRHAVLAQAVFVPGLSQIYEELLGFSDYELCKLETATPPASEAAPDTTIEFAQLLIGIHGRDRSLPIAIELWTDGSRAQTSIVVNPPPDLQLDPTRLKGLYAIRARKAENNRSV